jgi:hypothetical protein
MTATDDNHNLHRQRTAIAALGHELRTLVDTAVRTAASPATLHQAAAEARRLTAQLTGRRRGVAEIPDVDGFPAGERMYSPVTGLGSPLAPPLHVNATHDGLLGRCILGVAHEGPPGYAHGGMSALLLDELMGRACATAGMPAMTVSLTLAYHQPVILMTPLLVTARITTTRDRTIHVVGSITTAADPTTALVTADGVFIAPDPQRARALFPQLAGAPGA